MRRLAPAAPASKPSKPLQAMLQYPTITTMMRCRLKERIPPKQMSLLLLSLPSHARSLATARQPPAWSPRPAHLTQCTQQIVLFIK
mmetsp:Transcript_13739/g.36809  ORF Transcript_13739/g.36809 Transcript_13739/m.36809 type:complete len:86 (+) Transcript_13739:249-506(+)